MSIQNLFETCSDTVTMVANKLQKINFRVRCNIDTAIKSVTNGYAINGYQVQ